MTLVQSPASLESGLPLPITSQRRSTTTTQRFSSISSNHSLPTTSTPTFDSIPSIVQRKLQFLTRPARTTNLAVFLLALISLTSLFYNLNHYFDKRSNVDSMTIPTSLLSTIDSPSYRELDHLVMVPGHAIWQGCDASSSLSDDDWILQSFQQDGNHVKTYLKHITKGAEIAVRDPKALLIFSGGQTRSGATLTEALSYLRLSRLGNVFDQFLTPLQRSSTSSSSNKEFSRVTTEDYAMDSFQNVLFSIARFKEFTGSYPRYLTVVGYGMKEKRYKELHRLAVRWNEERFRYVGIDNEGETELDYEGENRNGYLPFQRDLYGCHDYLLKKRKTRNPYRRYHSYHSTAPELRGLLEYCPSMGDTVYPETLPWER